MPFRGLTMLKKHNINHKRRFVLRIRHGVDQSNAKQINYSYETPCMLPGSVFYSDYCQLQCKYNLIFIE